MDATAVEAVLKSCLMWVGFGFVCGLTARAVLPGRDPGGAIVTVILGGLGALVGVAVFSWASGRHLDHLLSPVGFGVAVAGSIVLLVSHRLMSGRMWGNRRIVDGMVVAVPRYARRRRAVRYTDVD